MAQISYSEYLNSSNKRNNNANNFNGGFSVEFFKMTPGQEVEARILYDSPSEFEMLSTHEIPYGNGTRKINCAGDGCPLCASDETFTDRWGTAKNIKNLSTKMYIRLIEYVKNPDGTVKACPRIWERPSSMASELALSIDTYGKEIPFSKQVVKIVRIGSGKDTKYQIMAGLPQSSYPANIYVDDRSAFENYRVLGGIVMNKTIDEMNQYLVTKEFPQKQASNNKPFGQDAFAAVKPVADNVTEFADFTTGAPVNSMGQPVVAPQTISQGTVLPWESAPAQPPVTPMASPAMPWNSAPTQSQADASKYY